MLLGGSGGDRAPALLFPIGENGVVGQWEQLAMYMTAPDIKNKYSVHTEEMEDSNVSDEGALWNKKLKESKQRNGNPKSRYETFKKEGVKNPVEIGYSSGYPEGYIGEGHHRVASMEKIDPQRLLPVTHDYEGPIKFRGTF